MPVFEKMKRLPTIKAVMTPFPHSIEMDAPVTEATGMMVEHGIRHLPVMDGGAPVAVASERDIRLAVDAAGRSKDKLQVRDVCPREAYIVGLSEPLDRVLVYMANHHLECALVVKEGKLAGVFTMTDAFRAFAELLRSVFPPGDGDQVA